ESAERTIPAGSQVVLNVAKTLADGARIKPPGSVGVVMEAPPHHHDPYVIRFADGQTVQATGSELSLRRREVDDELIQPPEKLRDYVFYQCQVGSKAFGLADESSDDDLRGIYLPPAELHWSMYRLPEQLEFDQGDQDEVYWELEKFLKLALKANPSILETLWTPLVLQSNEIAEELRDLREAFLSKHVYKTYSGYALSQFRRMANAYEKTQRYKPKHAMHLIRLMRSGIFALQTGEIRIDVGEHREDLLRVKAGELSFEEVRAEAHRLIEEFQAAFESTQLPDQPDFARADDFLIRSRRKMTDA
ncbi:MAG: nucleotidyltransferase domain-containing protein, partial [Planctomycetales bacterium]